MEISKTIIINAVIFIIFNILFIAGFIYQEFIYDYKTTVEEINNQLINAVDGLKKNYIYKVRLIDPNVNCWQIEKTTGYTFKDYTLLLNTTDNEHKQNLKICYEVHYDYNFESLSEQTLSNNEEYNCHYKGLSFKSNENTQCPITDIKFSSEESIPNYEKIAIQNNNKLSLFIKRSDINEVPLIGLSSIKQNSYIEKELSGSEYSMDYICKESYLQYESECQIENKPKLVKFSLFSQTPPPIDSNEKAIVFQDFVYPYPNPNLLPQPHYNFETSFLEAILSILKWILNLIKNIIYYIYYYSNYLCPIISLYFNFDVITQKDNIDHLKSNRFSRYSYFLALISLYPILILFIYMRDVEMSLSGTQYYNLDPLLSIHCRIKNIIFYCIIIFWSFIILILSDVMICILSTIKIPKSFVKLQESQMTETKSYQTD